MANEYAGETLWEVGKKGKAVSYTLRLTNGDLARLRRTLKDPEIKVIQRFTTMDVGFEEVRVIMQMALASGNRWTLQRANEFLDPFSFWDLYRPAMEIYQAACGFRNEPDENTDSDTLNGAALSDEEEKPDPLSH